MYKATKTTTCNSAGSFFSEHETLACLVLMFTGNRGVVFCFRFPIVFFVGILLCFAKARLHHTTATIFAKKQQQQLGI